MASRLIREDGLAGGTVAVDTPAPLAVVRLTLTDFRCYRHQRVETDSRPVVFTGPNGAGKTNILEALSFLIPGRGLRGARLGEVARRDAGATDDSGRSWGVAARLLTHESEVEIGTGREAPATAGGSDRRIVRIDGRPAKSQAAMAEYMNVQWLTPRMDRLFAESASPRRRFLDRLVFGFDPPHAGRVSAYQHAMRERARLLRRGGPTGGGEPGWLNALEEAMAANGVAVAAARLEVVARMDEACRQGAGPFPGAALFMDGEVEGWLSEGPALAAEERLRKTLADSRRIDADAGGACTGPHRSDLKVHHLANGLPAENCSTGEQKALVIAVVLAAARLQAAERGSVPLLLLDEVAAHLDSRRREALFDEILVLGSQAWMTGTDAALFSPLRGRARFFTVEDAVVTPDDGT